MHIPARSIDLHVIDEGAGTAVVFLHGSGGSTEDWTAQLAALSGSHRTIAIDLRGFGASEVTADDLSLQDYADDVIAVLDELHVDEAVFVGLSAGGVIALQIASSTPERVRGLLIADATSRLDEQVAAVMGQTKAALAQITMAQNVEMMRPLIFASATIAAQADHIRDYEARFAQGDPIGLGLVMQAISRIDLHDKLGAVTAPTLVVVGAEDQLLPLPHSVEIADAIPGAELQIIDGASHLSNLDQPEAFTDHLRSFLARIA